MGGVWGWVLFFIIVIVLVYFITFYIAFTMFYCNIVSLLEATVLAIRGWGKINI